MSKIWMVGACALVVTIASGCSSARRCETDGDCGADALCDPELRVCVESSARCEPACPDHAQCTGLNACEARFVGVDLVQPTSGARMGARATEVRAHLQLGAGRQRVDPTSLKLEVKTPSGAMDQAVLVRMAAGEFVGTYQAIETGTHELVAVHEDAGLRSAALSVEAEFVGPEFLVTWPSPPARIDGGETNGFDPEPGYGAAWRRDERVRMRVLSNSGDLAVGSVHLVVFGTDGGTSLSGLAPKAVAIANGDCDASYCGEVEVDLAEPEMLAFRGAFRVMARGEDLGGNAGEEDAEIRVTRWKWRWESEPAGVVATPAIGAKGTVYVGTDEVTGPFAALAPNGRVLWTRNLGSVRGSPAVHVTDDGDDVVFVSSDRADRAELTALQADGGTRQVCELASASGAQSAVALMKTSRPTEEDRPTALAYVNAPTPTLHTVRLGSASPCRGEVTSGTINVPGNIIISDGAAYFASASTQAISRYTADQSSAIFVPSSGWPTDAGVRINVLSASPESLVGAARSGGVFAYALTDGTPEWSVEIGTAASAVSSNGSHLFWGDDSGDLFRASPGEPSLRSSSSAEVVSQPLIGLDQSLYVVRGGGFIEQRSSDLNLRWSVRHANDGTASPTIDCSRNSVGERLFGRPGVLYLGTTTPGGVVAMIVDSRGIDTSAPWPKYQHDPRNTGNTATDLGEFSCE